jgi:peroxiredoxin
MVKEGDPAPDFTLSSEAGDEVTLSSLRGRLWFFISTRGTTR